MSTEKLQIIDMYEHDNNLKKYEICLFCKNTQLQNYCIRVKNFYPFFYILIPPILKDFDQIFLKNILNLKFTKTRYVQKICNVIKSSSIVQSKILGGYQTEKNKFILLTFENLYNYKRTIRFLQQKKNIFITDYTSQNISENIFDIILCECNIQPFIKFCHIKNIKPISWIQIKEIKKAIFVNDPENKISKCHEIIVAKNNIETCEEKTETINFKIASFDIETTTANMNEFPNFQNEHDTIVQIGTTISDSNNNYFEQFIATLGECDDIPNAIVKKCTSEKEIIEEWCDFIEKIDPDIITGYNIFGYDYEYIFERALRLNLIDKLCQLSRFKNIFNMKQISMFNNYEYSNQIFNFEHQINLKKLYKKQKTSSSAFGDNESKIITMIGRIQLDLLKYCRENGDKLSNYKLDNVAKHYGLKQGKNDMEYSRIFQIFRNGSSKEKKIVAEYCIQDCLLCNQLIDKLNIINNCVGIANICFVPLNYIFNRGQSIRIYSLLLKECLSSNYIIPLKEKKINSYQGAIILEANKGIYYQPINVLDFASLYPSCIISHNLCISTKLTLKQIHQLKLLPNEYKTVEWYEDLTGAYFINKLINYEENKCTQLLQKYKPLANICINYHFLKNRKKSVIICKKITDLILTKYHLKDIIFFKDFEIIYANIQCTNNNLKYLKQHHYIQKIQGIIPKILQKLLNARNNTRKKMKTITDKQLLKVYNGLQLSYKIIANSVYGQLSTTFCEFANSDVAESVTATGRQLLELTCQIVKQYYYKSEIIYGDTDSVFIKFYIQNHKHDCLNHKNNIHLQLQKYQHLKNINIQKIKQQNKLGIGPYIQYKHSIEYTAINLDKKFRLRDKCDCPVLSNLFSEEALIESIYLSYEVSKLITNLLPCHKQKNKKTQTVVGVHELEYEKTYLPFLIFTKKRYIGKLYENNTNLNEYKLDFKGIVLKRRDNCSLLKNIYKQCLDLILNKQIDDAVQLLDELLYKLLHNQNFEHFPMQEFIITKTLRALSSYKSESSSLNTEKVSEQLHVALAKRIAARNNSTYQVGMRLPYCFVENLENNENIENDKSRKENAKTKKLLSEYVETPEYIQENNLKINYEYYIERQLRKPIIQLFSFVISSRKMSTIFQKHLAIYQNKKNKIVPITNYFKKSKTQKKQKKDNN